MVFSRRTLLNLNFLGLIAISCSPKVFQFEYYKYFPGGLQESENNRTFFSPTTIQINNKHRFIVINSDNKTVDTLVIKSPPKNNLKLNSRNQNSLLVYSIKQKVSGMVQMDSDEFLLVLNDSKWYFKKQKNYKN